MADLHIAQAMVSARWSPQARIAVRMSGQALLVAAVGLCLALAGAQVQAQPAGVDMSEAALMTGNLGKATETQNLGTLRGLSASQTLQWQGLHLTPELSWTQLSNGPDTAASQRHNLRLGVSVQMPL